MDEQLAEFVRALSTLLGWLYVLSWSLSFYPQPTLNWKRKSTVGVSVDYPALNLLGFLSYTISTACFSFSPVIRRQYSLRHPLSPVPTVRVNDFVFAAHGFVLVVITYSQFYTHIWGFHVPSDQRTSWVARVIIIGSLIAVLVAATQATFTDSQHQDQVAHWTWIDVIYIFGDIKLVVTCTKYAPQAWLNFKSKSTRGWSIGQMLFDFAGGVLSLAQLLIDSSFQDDWSGVTGNPAKLGLATVSLCFDIVFITQHYILYTSTHARAKSSQDDARQPLLSDEISTGAST